MQSFGINLPTHLTYKSSFNHLYFIPVWPLFQDRICEQNVFGQDFLQRVILYQRNEFPLRLIKCKKKTSIRADSGRSQARTLTALPLRVVRLAELICIYLHAGPGSGGQGCPGSAPAAAAESSLSLVDATVQCCSALQLLANLQLLSQGARNVSLLAFAQPTWHLPCPLAKGPLLT